MGWGVWSGGGLAASGALGAGPWASGRPGVLDGRGGQGGGGEGGGMARCDSGSVVGRGLTSLLDGVKFMFFLWK